jgi:hypothetical protein
MKILVSILQFFFKRKITNSLFSSALKQGAKDLSREMDPDPTSTK